MLLTSAVLQWSLQYKTPAFKVFLHALIIIFLSFLARPPTHTFECQITANHMIALIFHVKRPHSLQVHCPEGWFVIYVSKSDVVVPDGHCLSNSHCPNVPCAGYGGSILLSLHMIFPVALPSLSQLTSKLASCPASLYAIPHNYLYLQECQQYLTSQACWIMFKKVNLLYCILQDIQCC